jgi:hypothetical protein
LVRSVFGDDGVTLEASFSIAFGGGVLKSALPNSGVGKESTFPNAELNFSTGFEKDPFQSLTGNTFQDQDNSLANFDQMPGSGDSVPTPALGSGDTFRFDIFTLNRLVTVGKICIWG